jgi:ubiquinone/menaquinone biosynthesis C-methylase UbiE
MENYIFDIFRGLERPNMSTSSSMMRAANQISEVPTSPEILELGCGCSLPALNLAQYFGGHICCVNSQKEILDELQQESMRQGYEEIIECVNTDIFHLDFGAHKFNIIWSEGAIRLLGIKRGIAEWKKYLCNYGYMALNDISWLKKSQPTELLNFWNREYPVMDYVENNLQIIESNGYNLIDYFVISPDAWWNEYYTPLDNRIKDIRYQYIENELAQEVFDYIQLEIDMYKKYSSYYGSVFYIMQMPH